MDRQRLQTIGAIALPIIGGMASQNVLNLVDTAMVGTLGDAALAAVGMGSFANFMAQAFITGMAAGVQATAARRLGEERLSETAVPLNGGLLLAIALAVPWALLLVSQADFLFPLLNDDPAVIAIGVPYFAVRLLGMVGVGCNYAFRGYWNGVNLSRLYLRTLLVMHATNIVLNYLLIFGALGFPELGAVGAGWASTIATYVGTATYVFLGLRHARAGGFLSALPSVAEMKTMLGISAPAGLQQFLFAAGYTALFWIVGLVGTSELAAANVVLNVTLVGVLPGLGLGLAAASLVGQALGRGDPDDAEAWGWDVARVAMVVILLIGLPMLLVPGPVLGVFLEDPSTIAIGAPVLRLAGATLFIDGLGLVLLNALLGAGASRSVMGVAVSTQWGIGLVGAYVAGPVLGGGLLGIWGAQVAYRVTQAAIFATIWRRRQWAAIQV